MALPYRSFGFQVLVGMVAGLALGLVARQIGAGPDGDLNWLATTLQTVGSIFVSLLKAIVPPLVFAAIVASIANLRALDNGARLAGQTLLWFAITALIAVIIGLAIGLIVQPGVGLSTAALAAKQPDSVGGWLDFLKGLVPGNSLALSGSTSVGADGTASTSIGFNILQLLVIAIAVGLATLKVGEKAEPFLAFVRSLLAVVRALLGWVIRMTPIGSAGLIGAAVATYGWDALARLGVFTGAIYLGLAIVLLIVYPTLLIAHGLKPLPFFAKAWPAIQLGFVSRSSVGTMPVTEAVTERLGVDKSYAAFAIPLASTTKMDGCASIYPALSAIFVAGFYGIPLSAVDYALIALVSVIGSAATAGLTGATVMLTLTLSTLGLPLEGAGLLLAIDPILDMGRTAVNVTGQVLVGVIVAKREGILDESAYYGERALVGA
ncbi:MAG: dicarboxylate/amino acid:cation symporter [Pseudomonadota bacterium]|uniref:Dicarboxylate/amino acid:cation symporter n=1 Tax=Sphingobium xenophagum TaxID=121428 RepID=A0A249MWN7_SPHXE|nr:MULTISPECIES: dicarboxylate/amino acid:cation symporter [Sphingobium]ASY45549.1 dicarboxylate/amino acid:cation symporter [Sphingobium xenophagum]OUC55000.1 dicarboxylate/amino acid:cation symporter [Sphingobium sp. GW456-12-10-14-TSB1]QWT13856.1 dicarboxylate/amino acid:cation symporter [Sphingobium xenophagum]